MCIIKKVFGFLLFFIAFLTSLSLAQIKNHAVKAFPPAKKDLIKETIINTKPILGDEYWDEQFIQINSPDNIGSCLFISGQDVYVGGAFKTIKNRVYNYLAKWNSNTGWSNLGQGLSYYPIGIKVINNLLYVGGEFGAHYGVPGKYVATWDGNSWSVPGDGVNNNVVSFYPYQDNVIIMGSFTIAGNINANRIAIWNPALRTWSRFGFGFDADAYCAIIDGPDIYVGGDFVFSGMTRVNRIAKWDDIKKEWLPFFSTEGANNTVMAMVKNGDDIYFGGVFTRIGNIEANHIARWNKKTNMWYNLGKGVYGNKNYVETLAIKDDNLFVGGTFSMAGEIQSNNIAIWDMKNETWSSLGSGTNGKVASIGVSDNIVYLTGSFTEAGGKPSYYFARYTLPGNQPAAPILYSPVNLENVAVQNPVLLWNTYPEGTAFRLQVATDPDFSNLVIDQNYLQYSSFQCENFQLGPKYYWRVNATNGFGTSDWSVVWSFSSKSFSFSKLAPQLSLPLNNATNITTKVPLIWIPLDGAVSYKLQLALDPNFDELLIDKSDITNAYFAINRLLSDSKYYWRVSASNGYEKSLWSEARNFRTKVISGISEILSNKEFVLYQNYPNPFNPSTTIEYDLKMNTSVSVKIYNSQGIEIETLVNNYQKAGNHKVQWIPKNLSSGIYYYKFLFDSHIRVGKMLFMK